MLPIQALGVSRGVGCHAWRRHVKRRADTIAHAPWWWLFLLEHDDR